MRHVHFYYPNSILVSEPKIRIENHVKHFATNLSKSLKLRVETMILVNIFVDFHSFSRHMLLRSKM